MPTGGMSFWNFNRTISDYTPMLRKYLYQSASRSAQANKLKDEDIDDGATYGRSDEVDDLLQPHWGDNVEACLTRHMSLS